MTRLDLSGDARAAGKGRADCLFHHFIQRPGWLVIHAPVGGGRRSRFRILDSHHGQTAPEVFCPRTNLASRKSDIHISVGAEINLTYSCVRLWTQWTLVDNFSLHQQIILYILGLMLFYMATVQCDYFLLTPL